MFKAALTLALFSTSLRAQDLQSLINQAGTSAGSFVNDLGGFQQTEDSVALNVNDYEWVLTSYDGELELSLSELANNANNLGPAVTALLTGAGAAAQDNAGAVSQAIENPNPGIVVNDNGLASSAIAQYSPQAQDNAQAISSQAVEAYNQAAAALISNENGALDQVNQQLNDAANGNQGANADTLGNIVSQAIANAPNNLVEVNANNIPALVDLGAPLAGGANGIANSVDASQAAEAFNNAAGDASASLSNLPAGVADGVSSAASNVASAASDQLSNAANNIANQAVNTLNAAGIDLNALGNQ